MVSGRLESESPMPGTMKKIAIFHTDHAAEWTEPYGTFDEMTVKLLNSTKPEELDSAEIKYEIYDIYNGQFPSLTQLAGEEYMGIFITGSRYDSFCQDTEWILRLRAMLKEILNEDDATKYPPIVGICFGHQVVACALGGVVDRNPVGFEGGVVPVELNSLGQRLFGQDHINLSMVHNDAVLKAPANAVADHGSSEPLANWGRSSRCEIQGFYKRGRLLTFQGHPEFVSPVAKKGWEKVLESPGAQITPSLVAEMELQTSTLQNEGYTVAAKPIWQLFKREI